MRTTIATIIPRIILIAALLDFALRFTQISGISHRPLEPLARYHAVDAPFEANALFQSDRVVGDLIFLANLPQYQHVRSERFSTDEIGFRKNDSVAEKNSVTPQIILAGDSFSVGFGVNDDATLASQLEGKSGIRTYNAGYIALDPGHVLSLAARLGVSSGTVIVQYLGRQDLPLKSSMSTERAFFPINPTWANKWPIYWHGFTAVSPLEILAHRLLLKIQNDKILPNPFSASVKVFHLRNSDPMLFYAPEVKLFDQPRKIDLSGWEYLNEELAKENFQVVFVLVPDKYSVYQPLLADSSATDVRSDRYLNELELKCRTAGLRVINLSDLLRKKAKEELEQGHLIYFYDDTHWNERGIEFAVEGILEQINRRFSENFVL